MTIWWVSDDVQGGLRDACLGRIISAAAAVLSGQWSELRGASRAPIGRSFALMLLLLLLLQFSSSPSSSLSSVCVLFSNKAYCLVARSGSPRRFYVLLPFLSFFVFFYRLEISELRRPIAVKLCNRMGSVFYFIT